MHVCWPLAQCHRGPNAQGIFTDQTTLSMVALIKQVSKFTDPDPWFLADPRLGSSLLPHGPIDVHGYPPSHDGAV